MAQIRKKLISEERREKTRKVKQITALILFLMMLLVMVCYAIGLDEYLHPTPKKDPVVSSWGEAENVSGFDWEAEDMENPVTEEPRQAAVEEREDMPVTSEMPSEEQEYSSKEKDSTETEQNTE